MFKNFKFSAHIVLKVFMSWPIKSYKEKLDKSQNDSLWSDWEGK